MPKAIWKDRVVAETDTFETMEGNVYFPADSLKQEYFKESTYETVCPWKGTANYYSLEVDGETLKDAAWVYKTPKQKAMNIKDHYAFWKGVKIEKE